MIVTSFKVLTEKAINNCSKGERASKIIIILFYTPRTSVNIHVVAVRKSSFHEKSPLICLTVNPF